MNKNRNLAVLKQSLMETLIKDNMSEEMTIALDNPKREIKGLYFDGERPSTITDRHGNDAKTLVNMYECRASDDDPMGAPVTIAPKDKHIIVNFAGTFVTVTPIQNMKDDEEEIVDYSYE